MSSQYSRIAEDYFGENFRLFGNPPGEQPEKFNLYNGLTNLAAAIRQIENKLDSIEYELSILARKVR